MLPAFLDLGTVASGGVWRCLGLFVCKHRVRGQLRQILLNDINLVYVYYTFDGGAGMCEECFCWLWECLLHDAQHLSSAGLDPMWFVNLVSSSSLGAAPPSMIPGRPTITLPDWELRFVTGAQPRRGVTLMKAGWNRMVPAATK
jgi:hypothetical protein